jgi:triosephosphate isomerase
MTGTRRRPFVAGNWKMNKSGSEAWDLLQSILKQAPAAAEAELLVIPPFTALAQARETLAGSAVKLGAQDLFWQDQGAFTGEVSGPMLRDAGCAYVLVGHSERRQHFGEGDAVVNLKIAAALRAGLTPIVCIGETLEEREAGQTAARLDAQVEYGLKGLSDRDICGLIVAYEPVWAIGTGRTASPDQAEQAHAHIRKRLETAYGNDVSSCAIILYGGSVKPANAFSLFREKDIDGFLVGGASLEADSFLGIAAEALRADKEKT